MAALIVVRGQAVPLKEDLLLMQKEDNGIKRNMNGQGALLHLFSLVLVSSMSQSLGPK